MQTKNPLNSLPIENFIQRVKSADNSKQKEIRMTMDEAKQLRDTLAIVLARLAGNYEDLIQNSNNSTEEVISLSVDGGQLS